MTTAPEAPPARSLGHAVAQALPGIALAASIAAAAYLLSRWITEIPLSPIMIAVVLGALVSSVAGARAWITTGLETLPRLALRIAIVLLGFQISVADVRKLGISKMSNSKKLNYFSLRELRALVTVAETGSVAGAAAQKALKRLRKLVGLPGLEPGTRPL